MFKYRSRKKELLDALEIPDADLFQNLKELHCINTSLGGYNITLKALKNTLKKGLDYHIIDIGSGGGDTLKTIKQWNQKLRFNMDLTGVDLKGACIQYANQHNPQPDIQFVCADYKEMPVRHGRISIIHASLFCHHLSEAEIIELIRFAMEKRSILIINDLERNLIAYYAIKILTFLFSHSYLVRHDAPLSVLRGFKRSEWLDMIHVSGAKTYSIKNRWAFRHEIIIDTREP